MLSNFIQNNLQDVVLIVGLTRGRDAKDFLSPFKNIVKKVYCVKVHSEPNSNAPKDIATKAELLGFETGSYNFIDEVITEINCLSDKPKNILVCGSLFLANEIGITV